MQQPKTNNGIFESDFHLFVVVRLHFASRVLESCRPLFVVEEPTKRPKEPSSELPTVVFLNEQSSRNIF